MRDASSGCFVAWRQSQTSRRQQLGCQVSRPGERLLLHADQQNSGRLQSHDRRLDRQVHAGLDTRCNRHQPRSRRGGRVARPARHRPVRLAAGAGSFRLESLPCSLRWSNRYRPEFVPLDCCVAGFPGRCRSMPAWDQSSRTTRGRALLPAWRDVSGRTQPGIEEARENPRSFSVRQFVSACWEAMNAMTDEQIELVGPANREHVAKALRELADRFEPAAVSVSAG